MKKNVKKTEQNSKKLPKKWENQLKIVVIFMVVLILAIVVLYLAVIFSRTFDYKGIEFTKGKQGPLIMYLAKFPVADTNGELQNSINIYFREDPRKLERIELNDNILIKSNVAVAANTDFVENCSDSILAAATLSAFLAKAGINAFPATTDKREAELFGRRYVDCSLDSETTVISMEIGNESKITRMGNCYTLEAANGCEIMNVTERFLVGLYATSRGL